MLIAPFKSACAASLSVLASAALCQKDHVLHEFESIHLSGEFYSEGATFGDLNGDGKSDVISGPYWYAGPDFTERHEIYPPSSFDVAVYSNNFFAFVYDFNRDGANDVLFVGFPGKEAIWYENPRGKPGHWPRHRIFEGVDNESPTFRDLTGDGLPELIFQTGDRLGWASPDWEDPSKPWVFHPISPKGVGGRFTHGLGIGDVDGDGRTDILSRQGWWQQPESLDGDPGWFHHPVQFAGRGGAQMYVSDLDGDGDNDVISSWNAHGYGLYWFEHVVRDGKIEFIKHQIMGETPGESRYGLVIGNLHAIDFVDMDGDGLKDIVTGSRYWAHSGRDKADLAPPLVYWFKVVRGMAGEGVDFVPHEIDKVSGVGTQVVAGDVDGDGLVDVVVGNKKGTYLHLHRVRKVTRDQYLEAHRRAVTSMRSLFTERQIDRSGTVPAAGDGRPLNLGFETGDLVDWVATGEAFRGLPVIGDTVRIRRSGSSSAHAGRFWVGTYEVEKSDRSLGVLTSARFRVAQPFASFLVGGGSSEQTRVELVRADTDQVFHRTSGRDRENMIPHFVDLADVRGEEIYIRLVDEASGGWGHINFDDFLLHEQDPRAGVAGAEGEQTAGYLPVEAARRMTVPSGFRVELVAGEPDLHQPIAFCMDDRARLWVAEAYSYPVRKKDGEGQDKILVFTDSNGDGSYDRRTVFADGLNLISGLAVGHGGVWVGAAPYLMFLADRDGDLKPDGEPEVLLDGWGYQDTHETLNSFIWGPDGWLYGCHGVFTDSNVGKPGTPDEDRVKINAGVWRYHPTRHEFEVFAWGTSNPWGVDFDDHGQALLTACVIPHLYHMAQGGRYQRQSGPHFNPYIFDDIKTIADHLHYLGADSYAGTGISGSVGGGHAHCGAMVYLGDSFPERYRNSVFMNNVHGNRVNVDVPRRLRSGFTGSHGDDFLLANDRWYMGVNLRYGPDGSVFLIDWYDAQACHDRRPEKWDRTNGRMYKVSYGEPRVETVDLGAMSNQELVQMQLHENDWFVRVARRLLQERGPNPLVHGALRDILTDHADTTRKLRALWALHVTGGLTEQFSLEQLASAEEYVRAWTIQLLLETRRPSPAVLAKLGSMAVNDPSPVVRLYLASALQRLSLADRWPIAEGLVGHAEDRNDQNIPLMIWYGIEPALTADPARALRMAAATRLPVIARYIVRRMASGSDARLDALLGVLNTTRDEGRVSMFLGEMIRALQKSGDVAMPSAWPATARRLMDDPKQRDQATTLALIFGDRTVVPFLRRRVADAAEPRERREQALRDLLRFKDPELPPVLHGLLADAAIAVPAIRGLASFDDAHTPDLLIRRFSTLDGPAQRAAIDTLTSRARYAKAMLEAVIDKRIPATVLDSATTRQQIGFLRDDGVNELMGTAWGRVAPISASAQAMTEGYKRMLSDEFMAKADLPRGRALFAKTCMACHKLFGEGIEFGPDITGSNRNDLDYILGNILDPSAEVGRQHMISIVMLKDGRVFAGMIDDQNAQTLTIRNLDLHEVVKLNDIARRDGEMDIIRLETSVMPPGQLAAMSNEEVRDLLAYLGVDEQVPMRATAENLETFFNGKDLTGWDADPELWSVQGGEVVGKSSVGLDRNAFARSHMLLTDFRLIVEVKLVGNAGNSGIQFRSEPFRNSLMKGYQADIAAGWWGKLYEEHGRGVMWNKPGDQHVRAGDWNTYEILAVGRRIRTALNGHLCVDLEDSAGAAGGVIGLQLHSGVPMEVRFRNFRLELNPSPAMRTVR